jgi:hypothetical protein
MVIISVVESNLAIISAAYPSVRSFLNKVSTGLLVAETAHDSKSRSKSGSKLASYSLQTIGSAGKRNSRNQPTSTLDHQELDLGDKTLGQNSATVRGDTKSDRSFGIQAIMVRRSVDIDEASVHGN